MTFCARPYLPFGSPIWTPADLAGSKIWYTADEPLNTIVGGLIDTLYDKSGGGKHATPHTGSIDRASLTRTLNSRAVLTISPASGTSRGFLRTGTNSIDNNTDGTTIFVVSCLKGAGWSSTVWADRNDGYYSRRVLAPSNAGLELGGRRLNADGYTSTRGAATDTNWHVTTAVYDNAAGQLYASQDGTVVLVPTAWQSAGNTDATDSMFYAIGFQGNGSGFSSFGSVDEDIAEVLIVRGVMTLAARQKMEGYLAWKWGLEANLPAGHPYKAARP